MLSSLALSLGSQAACSLHVPMLGAVGAVANHIRPWLATHRHRRSYTAPAVDSDVSDAETAAVSPAVQTHAVHAGGVQQPAPIPAVPGRIHSIDTFSAVDGPGLRMVVFEQVGSPCMTTPGTEAYLHEQGSGIDRQAVTQHLCMLNSCCWWLQLCCAC